MSGDPGGGESGSGQDEKEFTGDRPRAGEGGPPPEEARPGPREGAGQSVAPSPLPRRVRGMSDGPRPPARVVRPVLPPSFLERVRAAAEAEQLMEQAAQEGPAQPPPAPEPPAARPVKEAAAPAQAGPPAPLPRRKAGASPRPAPDAQPRAGTPAGAEPGPADASTEPIPVIQVSPAGEPLPPAGMDGGSPAHQDPSLAAAPTAPAQPPAAADAGRPPAREAPPEKAAARPAAGRQARKAAARQAQQAAARRAADEAAVQRAAAMLARKSSPGRKRRLAGLAAVLLLVIGGVTAGFAFAGRSRHHDRLTSSHPAAPMVVNRDHAAAWIAHQVSPDAMVSCDPVTCVVIESHGFPSTHVQALATGQPTPAGSNLVVATPAVRHQFGARLASVFAPGLLATFGSGPQQVSIRIVAPHGAAAYQAGLRADLQNRRMSGAGLSGSDRIQAPSAARRQLAAGQVDSRLMISLALMASLRPVHLVSFGDGGPDPAAAPFRSARLSLTGRTQEHRALEFLSQQRPPYAPAHVTAKQAGPDQVILTMRFAAPSPVGLFH